MTDTGLRYRPEIFAVTNIEAAKKIILTAEAGTTTDERWEKETPFLLDDIGASLKITGEMLILDYGCGIGRLAKELINRFNCSVLGVDISPSMRQLAQEYVGSERFAVVGPESLQALVQRGLQVDVCYSLWVLQHCLDVHSVVDLIKQSVKPDGRLYILNSFAQVIPTDAGWATAGVDVCDLLKQEFSLLNMSKLPDTVTTKHVSDCTYIAVLKNDKPSNKALQNAKFAKLDRFLDKLSEDIYPEYSSELHDDITRKVIQRLTELYPFQSTTKILDVGCGQGLALEIFKKLGADAGGVTLGDDDLAACRARGFKVSKMDQSFLEFDDDSFNVIWARHVLEHSIFPLFTLAGFFRALKPHGILYVEVPSPDTDCHHEINSNHYSVLTRSSWRSHLLRSGFIIEEELTLSFTVDAGDDEYWGFFCRKPEAGER